MRRAWAGACWNGCRRAAAPLRCAWCRAAHQLRRPWPDDSACLLQQPDGRVVFLLPFAHDHLLVGTTDTDYRGDPARCSVLPSEVTYLCEAANRYLRDPIAPDEVVWAFAGVRPLLADPDPRAAQLSRDYRLQVQVDPAPALHVLGGKLTTYRVLAEEALDLLRPALPQMGPAWTARGDPLPGSDWATPHRRARCWRWHRGCPQVSRDAGPGPMAVAARNCCRVYRACTIWARTSAVACMHAKWTSCANASGRVTPTISCGAGASWGCGWMLRRWHGCRRGWRVGSLFHGKGSDPVLPRVPTQVGSYQGSARDAIDALGFPHRHWRRCMTPPCWPSTRAPPVRARSCSTAPASSAAQREFAQIFPQPGWVEHDPARSLPASMPH